MYLALRTETFAKLFFLVSCFGLFLYAILAFYTFHTAYTTVAQAERTRDFIHDFHSFELEIANDLGLSGFGNDLKYILFWTLSDSDPAKASLAEGQLIFTDHRCDYANCFLTTNKTMLNGDYRNFDAIVIDSSVVQNWKKLNMPQRRSQKQKYIFYSLEASDNLPVCNINADNYFNWTWTYKLNSDIVSPLIEVTDLQGNVVAPKSSVEWFKNKSLLMDSETHDNNKKQNRRKKTMAVVMENCDGHNVKPHFLKELQAEFKMNLLDFDIYGCGNLPCPREGCLEGIKKYNFYLVYENSVDEDYVSKEVIKAYKYDAVPVIIGNADYKKFLPDGSYVKVNSMTTDSIAAKVEYISRNPYLYASYFKWKKMYLIHETEEFRGICDLCAYLNEESKLRSFSGYKNFRKWWHPWPLYDKCIPKGAENFADVLAYINSSIHLK